MKNYEYFYFNKYIEYLNFLRKCSKKNYDENLVLHKHHIIPRHLCIDNDYLNSKKNIIILSVEDHIKSHLLISEIFPKNTREHILNLRSARILNKKSIKTKEILKKISETYVGELNPFFGKTHTIETKKKLSKISHLNRVGKTYEELYGTERAEKERQKRSKKTRSDYDYKVSGKKISKKLKGKYKGDENSFAQPYLVDGKYFGSRKSLVEYYGKHFKTIQKYHTVIKIERNKKSEYKN